MKTRILKTKFWADYTVLTLSANARYFFIHLLSCEKVNMCGVFEYLDEEICFRTGLSKKELELAKTDLQEKRRIGFFNNWIIILNAEKHNNYQNSPKNVEAHKQELDEIPQEVKKYFEKLIGGEIIFKEKPKRSRASAIVSYDMLLELPQEFISELLADYINLNKATIIFEAKRAYRWAQDNKRMSGNPRTYLRNWLTKTSTAVSEGKFKLLEEEVDTSVKMSPEVLKHAQPRK